MKAYVALDRNTMMATVSYNADALPPDITSLQTIEVPEKPKSLRMEQEARIAFTLMAYGYDVDFESRLPFRQRGQRDSRRS